MKEKILLVRIDSKYCDYLREFDNKVPYNYNEKELRPFVGVLFKIDKLMYFAPLSSPKPKHLKLKSKLDNFISNADENEKWIDGKAYLETVNNYPSVNIPVTGKFYDLLKQVKQYKEDNNTDAAEQSSSGEGEEAETTYTYNLYLWKDYVADTDTFSKTVSGNEDYDSRIAEKIIMSFNVEEIEDDM